MSTSTNTNPYNTAQAQREREALASAVDKALQRKPLPVEMLEPEESTESTEAKEHAAYYNTLIGNGVPHAYALQLTLAWVQRELT